MSYLRITEPNVSAVPIDDLGITIAQAATVVLSDQFSIQDLYLSADLEALIIAGTLTVELDYGTGYTAISAGDYTNRDALATFMNVYEITNENNNEDLVDGTDINDKGPGAAPLHIHDARYYTETEISSTSPSSGALLVGVDDTNFQNLTGTTAQALFDDIDDLFNTLVTLDAAYTNDSDGILNVNGTTKPLEFKSDGNNDVLISRHVGADYQTFLRADVSGDELILGALLQGALAQIDVRIASDLIVDGDITFTGTITDTTVNEVNVTNSKILLRDGATVGADASIEVERGATGADACLLWNETIDDWQFGIVGTKWTMVGNERDENIEGVWTFGGVDTTEPNLRLEEKSAAPTVNLGAAGEIPMAMMQNGLLAIYDKSNSRNKWLSVQREFMTFNGRDNQNNSNEYARCGGSFTSNQSSARLIRNATLVGISIQTNGAVAWTAEVRKNGAPAVLASLASGGLAGAQDGTQNVDFNAGDKIDVFINGSSVDRPLIRLEFAYRF